MSPIFQGPVLTLLALLVLVVRVDRNLLPLIPMRMRTKSGRYRSYRSRSQRLILEKLPCGTTQAADRPVAGRCSGRDHVPRWVPVVSARFLALIPAAYRYVDQTHSSHPGGE